MWNLILWIAIYFIHNLFACTHVFMWVHGTIPLLHYFSSLSLPAFGSVPSLMPEALDLYEAGHEESSTHLTILARHTCTCIYVYTSSQIVC